MLKLHPPIVILTFWLRLAVNDECERGSLLWKLLFVAVPTTIKHYLLRGSKHAISMMSSVCRLLS